MEQESSMTFPWGNFGDMGDATEHYRKMYI